MRSGISIAPQDTAASGSQSWGGMGTVMLRRGVPNMSAAILTLPALGRLVLGEFTFALLLYENLQFAPL